MKAAMGSRRIGRGTALLLLIAGLTVAVPRVSGQAAQPPRWSASGTLLESCTCAVPCTCNFGEGPSPNHFCHAVFAYRLDKAQWDGTDLSGLVVGGADGPDGRSGFLDSRATAEQKVALEKIGNALFAQGGPARGRRTWVPVAITHEVKDNDLKLQFGTLGGFTARLILGRDGKSPVVVENNTVWPIPRASKGKAQLQFKDSASGEVSGDGVNANYGAFTFPAK